MKRILILIALAATAGCSEVEHDKAYYLAHPKERAEKNAECRQPVFAGTPNCHAANIAEIAEMFAWTK